MAGILQTSGGRFNIGREFRDRIENGGAHAVYPDIFPTYARQFNWAYGDEYPGLEEVQYFFGFSLYLLARFGNEERPVGFYADACARAFPTTMSDPELLVDRLKEPEERFRDVYSRRTFGDFLRLLGLVDIRATSGRANPETFVVRARLLLSDAVKFQVD